MTLYEESSFRLPADFSSDTMTAIRQSNDIFKVLREKVCQPRTLCPEKLSFKNEGEIKMLQDKQELIIWR